MNREDYKAVKHMNKTELEEYLQRIYQRGYTDGVQALANQVKAEREAKAETPKKKG